MEGELKKISVKCVCLMADSSRRATRWRKAARSLGFRVSAQACYSLANLIIYFELWQRKEENRCASGAKTLEIFRQTMDLFFRAVTPARLIELGRKLKKEKDKTLGHEIKRWLQNPLSLLGLETKRCIFASGFSVLKLWDDNHRTKTRATKPTKRISTDLSPPKHPFFYVHETHFLPVFSLLLLSLHCVCR